MIYTDRKNLNCYMMLDEKDEIEFAEFRSILTECPSNVIYCEKNGKLYGVISTGDIRRAYKEKKDFVTVNKLFTCIKPEEYMHAKQIFKDYDKINSLPVINDKNELIGEYSRWDDLIVLTHREHFSMGKYGGGVFDKIALVRPSKKILKKRLIMQRFRDELQSKGVQVSIINRHQIMDTFDNVKYILFTDADELNGTGALYEAILGREFNWGRARTYSAFIDKAKELTNNEISFTVRNKILDSLVSAGIHVITLDFKYTQSNYSDTLVKKINAKFSRIGRKPDSVLYKQLQKDFFAELYSDEYVMEILNHNNYPVIHIDGVNKLKDTDRKTYKVTNGERRTLGQPVGYQRCIYFYGPCLIFGRYVEDKHTIESFLQATLNSKGYQVKCVNYGSWGDELVQLNRLVSTKFHEGDIVVLYNQHKRYEKIPNINLVDICEKHNIPATWMIESPVHGNHHLNRVYADEIFQIIEPYIKEDITEKEMTGLEHAGVELYLARWFDGFLDKHNGVNGAIVMNCNPFTLGHRYLIEQALKKVDHLIVFVVEEDQSLFTFCERFAMVTQGTKDLENVTVVPSGKFILSQTTFPEYFLKIKDEDIVRNVEYDITLFAVQIAPKLNIFFRFVGQELDDEVTDEYNKAMKEILPQYGINIVEIPRVEVDGKIVSASSVRGKLASGELENKFIPETTKAILELSWE